MQGPFWPPDHVAGDTGTSHPPRQGCGRCPPALLLLAGSTKDRVLSTVAATIAFLMLLLFSLLIPSGVCVCVCV